eukprot:m.511364 g.511364  ORF g.511364 m.511364 type:complete len:67 (+) comp101785_c0_seq1:124-324(+)
MVVVALVCCFVAWVVVAVVVDGDCPCCCCCTIAGLTVADYASCYYFRLLLFVALLFLCDSVGEIAV